MAREKVQFSDGNYGTKSSKLADDIAKCSAVFERNYRYLRRLAARLTRLSELSSKLERLNCSNWFNSDYRREYQSKFLTDHTSRESCNGGVSLC